MTETVINHAGSVIDHAETQNDLAIPHLSVKPERSARHDQKRKHGRVVLRIVAERKWLDALEERGYLDPFARGEPGRGGRRKLSSASMCVRT